MITRILVVFSFFLASSFSAFSQQDTTYTITYDMVRLTPKPGEKMGQSLHGEVLSIDASTGVLIFKTDDGRMYTLGVTEYEYYERGLVKVDRKRMRKQKKGKKELLPRKESGFEFGFGVSGDILKITHAFTETDQEYLNSIFVPVKNPISLKAIGGIYLNRQNYIGGTAEYAIIDKASTYIGFGGRYCYHYDAGTKNTSFYIPIEVKYNYRRFNVKYRVFDYFDPTFQTSISKDWEADISYQAATISLGHGFSFIKLNKRSIALELSMFTQIIPSVKFHNEFPFSNGPQSTFEGARGVRCSLLFNL